MHACPFWLAGKIKRLSRKKQKYNKACLTNNAAAYYGLKKKCKSYVAPLATIIYVSSLLDSYNKCAKKFWRYIKSMCKEQISINALLSNGETQTDSTAKANILNNQFISVFTKDDRGKPIPNIEQLSFEVNRVF